MLFTSLLPWVVVLQNQRENSIEVAIRNISRLTNVDLGDLCVDRLWNIGWVDLLDRYGNISRQWLIKFYVESNDLFDGDNEDSLAVVSIW